MFKHVTDAVQSVLSRPYMRGLVVVGNIGLHERREQTLGAHLNNIFEWAQSQAFGDMPGKHNDFFFRETNLQHFPKSPAGYYQVWIGKNKKGNPNNTCEDFDLHHNATHASANWRSKAEQSSLAAAARRFKSGKTSLPIRVIHFMNLSSQVRLYTHNLYIFICIHNFVYTHTDTHTHTHTNNISLVYVSPSFFIFSSQSFTPLPLFPTRDTISTAVTTVATCLSPGKPYSTKYTLHLCFLNSLHIRILEHRNQFLYTIIIQYILHFPPS